jgi:ABC-type branched-subunit amino acid transport system ATPase component
VSDPSQAPDIPLLRVRGLTKRFGGLPAVDGIDLDVAVGEIVAIIGPNGAGKSTLLQVINGLQAPTHATGITFDGADLVGRKPHQIRHAGIATVLQTPRMFAGMTVRENAALGAMFGDAAGGKRVQRAADPHVRDTLERLGLGDRGDAQVDELTLHQKRLLDLARALVGRPRMLLLDEVMAGLNPTEVDRFVQVIRSVRDDLGVTVVWVEHVMPAVTQLADRVVGLDAGRVLAQGPADEVMRHPQVIAAYLGRQDTGHAAG